MEEQLKEGDWVKVLGEGTRAFQVEWVNKGSVGLLGGDVESLHKVTILHLNEYEIDSYTVSYWRKKGI